MDRRREASILNPLICHNQIDTIINVARGIEALEQLSPERGTTLGENAEYGVSLILGCFRSALLFEVGVHE